MRPHTISHRVLAFLDAHEGNVPPTLADITIGCDATYSNVSVTMMNLKLSHYVTQLSRGKYQITDKGRSALLALNTPDELVLDLDQNRVAWRILSELDNASPSAMKPTDLYAAVTAILGTTPAVTKRVVTQLAQAGLAAIAGGGRWAATRRGVAHLDAYYDQAAGPSPVQDLAPRLIDGVFEKTDEQIEAEQQQLALDDFNNRAKTAEINARHETTKKGVN